MHWPIADPPWSPPLSSPSPPSNIILYHNPNEPLSTPEISISCFPIFIFFPLSVSLRWFYPFKQCICFMMIDYDTIVQSARLSQWTYLHWGHLRNRRRPLHPTASFHSSLAYSEAAGLTNPSSFHRHHSEHTLGALEKRCRPLHSTPTLVSSISSCVLSHLIPPRCLEWVSSSRSTHPEVFRLSWSRHPSWVRQFKDKAIISTAVFCHIPLNMKGKKK